MDRDMWEKNMTKTRRFRDNRRLIEREMFIYPVWIKNNNNNNNNNNIYFHKLWIQ